jgi:outer membrane protein assembly factor BamB
MLSGATAGALACLSYAVIAQRAAAQADLVGIYTFHGDNMRTGWNARETHLTHATVRSGRFGKLWSRPVDGQVYAQPLYAPAVDLGAAGTRNVVFVATEHNSVYAFDADIGGDTPLWQVSLGASVRTLGCDNITPEYGITSTPVIDPSTGILYVVANSRPTSGQFYHLHALDIHTGQERPGWPVQIQGSVPGNGRGSVNGNIPFITSLEMQRPGLLLLNGRVLIAFGAHCDLGIYHGWIFSYNASDPKEPPQIYNTTPDRPSGPNRDTGAGIWQSGFGLAADENRAVYFATGNGAFNADQGGRNVGDSFVRLNTFGGTLTFTPQAADFFAPRSLHEQNHDLDLGAVGAMVIPDQAGTTTPRLLVGAGKDGVIRLLNRDFLGGYAGRSDATAPDNILQTVPNLSPAPVGWMYGGPAYWEGPGGSYLFFAATASPLRRFHMGVNPNGGGASWLVPDGEGVARFGSANIAPLGPATPIPLVSSNERSAGTGIVWVLRRDDNTLRAYSAEDLKLLWHSGLSEEDELNAAVIKFSVPIVANGNVYAATENSLVCYGLRPN